MLRMNRKGFTLIELMIVVAIIGILAAVAIPMYRTQTVKAKMSEGVRAVDSLAGAVGDYYNDNTSWPPAMADATAINNTLGVGIDVSSTGAKISAIAWDDANRTITATFQNIASDVNGLNVVLTGNTTATGAVYWAWTGSVPQKYMPKK